MRTLGPAEIIVVVALLALLFGGKWISGLFAFLGKLVKPKFDELRWQLTSLGASEDEEIEAERSVGLRMAKDILAQSGEDPDEKAKEKLRQVGGRLAGATDGRREFTFWLLHTGPVNAFAAPGGHIFITRRLFDLLGQDDEEIAFVLGHEMAHVTLRHLTEKYHANLLLSAIGAKGKLLSLLSNAYSREEELEADEEGKKLAARAGFDERHAAAALQRIHKAVGDAGFLDEFWSTHPPFEERIKRLAAG